VIDDRTPRHSRKSNAQSENLSPSLTLAAVYFDELGERRSTPVYDRYALTPGTSITGPAVFEENESTFIVGPGARISLLPDGSIMAEYVS
jgi:N-methylhydantoinase A/oxoprolinase/acetone carboxylase beta subunit